MQTSTTTGGPTKTKRIESIDLLRGIIMVIMPLAYSWRFFLSIFQHTEYMEADSIEPMAKKILDESPAPQNKFEKMKAQDKAFANKPNPILTKLYSKNNYNTVGI